MWPPVARCVPVLLLLLATVAGCAPATSVPVTTSGASVLRYVALGDSYTIGTSVQEAERWPNVLVAGLAVNPPARTLELTANLGVNGFTAENVIRVELPKLEDDPAVGFVSLLVGVNDVVQGVPDVRYRERVELILDRLLARLPANRIVCVETPDYTVTPQGPVYGDPLGQRKGIQRVNAILEAACEARSIRFIDGIFEISSGASTDRSLVAGDGLHPSASQYRRWVVEQVEPAVRELLDQP